MGKMTKCQVNFCSYRFAHLKMDPWERKFLMSLVTYLESYSPVSESLWKTEPGLSDAMSRSRSEI